jgi:nitroimidazol reductase NimA-like FMN-containing flavoprotein (pyridoxamine 5'-phosphate oxidase superfamily)
MNHSPTPPPSERDQAYAILDQAPVCHIAFVESGEPMVLPAFHGRVGDVLYLHGSSARTLLRATGSGRPLCISAVLIDGVAVARCACSTAVNYRSVLLTGRGRPVEDPAEKARALRAITEHLTPGGWERGRTPSSAEIETTGVVALEITSVGVRTRSGPPEDNQADRALPAWSGIVPLRLQPGPPVPDPDVPTHLPVPPILGSRPASNAGAPAPAPPPPRFSPTDQPARMVSSVNEVWMLRRASSW